MKQIKTNFYKNFSLLILSIIFLSSKGYTSHGDNPLKIDDPIITQDKIVDPFDKLILSDISNNTTIYLDNHPILQLTGTQKQLNLIRTNVSSKTLTISCDNHNCNPSNSKIDITIRVPSLKKIVIKGGGNVNIRDSFLENIFQATIEGSGNIEALQLNCDTAYANITGSGSMHLTVNKLLKATINGGGEIQYKGDPIVDSKITSGGKVNKLK